MAISSKFIQCSLAFEEIQKARLHQSKVLVQMLLFNKSSLFMASSEKKCPLIKERFKILLDEVLRNDCKLLKVSKPKSNRQNKISSNKKEKSVLKKRSLHIKEENLDDMKMENIEKKVKVEPQIKVEENQMSGNAFGATDPKCVKEEEKTNFLVSSPVDETQESNFLSKEQARDYKSAHLMQFYSPIQQSFSYNAKLFNDMKSVEGSKALTIKEDLTELLNLQSNAKY